MSEMIFKNLKRKVLIKVMVLMMPLLLFFLIIVAPVIMIISSQGSSTSGSSDDTGTAKVSAQVLTWKPIVESYANEFKIPQYVNLILAVIQQESSGTLIDVMQSSEGKYNKNYPHIPNGITDSKYSIYCGIQELRDDITESGATGPNDILGISLALQGYNFGDGYISYAKTNGGYSLASAEAFSSMEAAKNGWSSYGDIDYVPHVLRYYSTSGNSGGGSGKLATVIQIAQSELGKDYVYGTAGPNTFDCSGLVYWCYSHSGFKITRETAQDYYNESTKTTNPDVGDLVFFGTPSNIHHIGIYIGNGQMIDAPQTGETVQIQSYNWSDFAGFGKYNNQN